MWRAVDLLRSQAAALPAVVLFDGLPLDPQPRLVIRPTPWAGESRHDFVYGTMYSLLAGRPKGGNAYWLTIERDDRGNAHVAAAAGPGRGRAVAGTSCACTGATAGAASTSTRAT